MGSDVRYGYACLTANPADVNLSTSESALVDWLVAEAKRMFPKCNTVVNNDMLGEAYGVTVSKLDGRDSRNSFTSLNLDAEYYTFGHAIAKQLFHQGWEPFQIDRSQARTFQYFLRKRL